MLQKPFVPLINVTHDSVETDQEGLLSHAATHAKHNELGYPEIHATAGHLTCKLCVVQRKRIISAVASAAIAITAAVHATSSRPCWRRINTFTARLRLRWCQCCMPVAATVGSRCLVSLDLHHVTMSRARLTQLQPGYCALVHRVLRPRSLA